MEMSIGSKEGERRKRPRRGEVLEKKKQIEGLIKEANSVKDPLTSFLDVLLYDRNGLSVNLKSGRGDKLSNPLKQYIQYLLKFNMEGAYGTEWPTEEKVKRREMTAPEARYIFVCKDPNPADDIAATQWSKNNKNVIVGFAHYRFSLEEEVPVLYVYELQLERCVQGKGLGEFLMQILERIARKHGMGAVMLTVQKANVSALMFYTRKLKYVMSCISPSRVGIQKNYEILCKTFNHEAELKVV